MQLQVFNNFISDFQEEEKQLLQDESSFAEKQRDIEKREKEELKRLEKQVFRRDFVEVEDAYTSGNAKALRDRIAKTINEGIVKQSKVLARANQSNAEA